jgi:hypothetical protein
MEDANTSDDEIGNGDRLSHPIARNQDGRFRRRCPAGAFRRSPIAQVFGIATPAARADAVHSIAVAQRSLGASTMRSPHHSEGPSEDLAASAAAVAIDQIGRRSWTGTI